MIQKMKRRSLNVLAGICSAFILCTTGISCKKSSDGGEPKYYMRFKENGTQVAYNTTAQAAFSSASGLYMCVLNGLDPKSNMNIILTDKSPIAANINYTEQILPGLANSYVFITYQNSNGVSFLSGNPLADQDASAKVTLTAITDDYVKGTFSGKLTNGSTIVTITEGEFILKRVN